MQKTRSDFDYSLDTISGHKVIFITDLNLGNMSVTNDIENVVDFITGVEKINPQEYLIIYQDSEGTWDGWDGKNFVPLNEDNSLDAARKYIQITGLKQS